MRVITNLVFTLMLLLETIAQQQPTEMTLDDCVKYALENNELVRISQFDSEIAEAQVRETTAAGLPQANINAGINYNFDLQENILPARFSDPNAAEGEEIAIAFGRAYDGNVALSINQLLFDGSYFVGLQAAKTFRELSSKEKIQTEIDIVEAVNKAYYNALITVEQLELLDKNIGRLDTLLRETNSMYEAGFAEKVDVDRIRVNYNNLKVDRSRSAQLQQISEKLLKFQMGMDLSQPIILTESLEAVEVIVPPIRSNDFDYNQRIEFSQLTTNETLAYLDMKNNKAQYLPKLNLSFGYGWNTASDDFSQLFIGRRWLDFGALGLSASIPVFDGFLKSNRIQQNKLQIKQVQSQMTYLKKSIDLEIEQSRINLNSQVETLDVQRQNVALAQEVYDITKMKYQEGVGSNSEVIDADTSLKEAQTNYLNSLFDAITSEIELKKALGILYQN
ncbi:MAG: TolC family protein [Bacteroidota bacterium]